MLALSKRLELVTNILGFLGITGVILLAIIMEYHMDELPCPLCLLQRVGFSFIALGFLMNCCFGLRPRYYGIVLVSALYTAAVALRQVLLHIVPGTGAYGDPILGMHLYTWSFLLAMITAAAVAMLLVFSSDNKSQPTSVRPAVRIGLCSLLILVSLANGIGVFFECGLHQCPENPVTMELALV
ncbi:MAG: disulfide bond formation protein B [Legionellales bacterium]|nr:disulfide bond formation protein B [Legionellales bacterium]|tara:strand:+ start:17953 stop:18504 length:552 start_codon:yes stop_codon:yes gene_type:complete